MANTNSAVSASLRGGGGSGGGLITRTPADTFTGANLAACRTARDTYFGLPGNAGALREFQASQFLSIVLDPGDSAVNVWETYAPGNEGRAYDNIQWLSRGQVVQGDPGPRGPGPTNNQVTAAVQAGVKPYARVGGPVVPESEVDAAILRDSEVTQAFLLNILTLSAQELDDLFVGAVVSGAGAGRVITVTQADGSIITLAVPDTTGGGGGGEGSSDGRVASGAFAADGTTLTLTLTTGGTVSISVPSALRQAGLSQSQVQSLIAAALAEDVVLFSSNTSIPAMADGDTYVHTGSSNVTLTLPRASGQGAVRNGYEQVIANHGAGDLTIDGFGADTINSAPTLVIDDIHRTVRLQKIGNSAWAVIADTKDDTASGDGGADQTARDDAAAAQRAADAAQSRADEAYTLADGKQNALTQTQLVDLLQFDVVPGVIVGYTTDGQAADWLTDWRVWVSGGDTVGDVWMEMQAEGQSLLAVGSTAPGQSRFRVKLDATNIYNFTLSNNQRTNLVTGRTTRRQGRDIEIDLRFHDAASGGNVIDVKTVAVDWVASVGGLNQAAVDARVMAVAGPVIIVSNIASFDATQNRFEDSAGNEVTIPNGSLVALTQAVYDAAATDAQFTPNVNAVFITR